MVEVHVWNAGERELLDLSRTSGIRSPNGTAAGNKSAGQITSHLLVGLRMPAAGTFRTKIGLD